MMRVVSEKRNDNIIEIMLVCFLNNIIDVSILLQQESIDLK